jgi:isoleucyl-tRNA synthetase
VIDDPARLTGHAAEVADELRVKDVVFEPITATEISVRPNLKVLGPRLGGELSRVRQALASGEFDMQANGSVVVAGHTIAEQDLLIERRHKDGWIVASSNDTSVTIALDTAVTDELRLKGRVYDLIHKVNNLRKESGFAITDRIELDLPTSDADLLPFADWLKAETVAVSLTATGDEITIRETGSLV